MTNWLFRLRNRHFFYLDFFIFLLTPALALALRMDGLAIARYWQSLLVVTAVFLVIKVAVFLGLGLYQHYWRYASIDELANFALAGAGIAFFQAAAMFFWLRPTGWVDHSFPRSIPFLDVLLAVPLAGIIRYSVRYMDHRQRRSRPTQRVRAIVAGAGDAGVMIVRELQRNPQLGITPVAFIDDDKQKHHIRIQGLTVQGGRLDIPRLARELEANQVIMAMPSAPGKEIREIVTICEKARLQTKIIPGMYELLDGAVSVKQLREVQIEDLLRREPVQTDVAAVQALLAGKRVLITGGGGSIGSELCRQVWRCGPAQLILLGHGENSVFEAYHDLRRLGVPADRLTALIADVRFPELIHSLLKQHRPDIIFHAAAHKHVPLMEQNPAEAITNNVLGTRNLLQAALAANVERFVMISTDKAVKPTSVMGASKRVAELMVHRAAQQSGRPYVAVRFGNVLGSRGSVVLTFQKQIAAGGPVTVTDPEMTRFFMTIPEAVQLVLQASVLGSGGEVFVLDMGEPVKIVDLARDLIELSGLEEGRDIDIVYTGLRPGEKMYEELFIPGEDYHRTRHQKIFIAANASRLVPVDLEEGLNALAVSAQRNDREAILRGLCHLIPEYEPQVDNPTPPKKQVHPVKDGAAQRVLNTVEPAV